MIHSHMKCSFFSLQTNSVLNSEPNLHHSYIVLGGLEFFSLLIEFLTSAILSLIVFLPGKRKIKGKEMIVLRLGVLSTKYFWFFPCTHFRIALLSSFEISYGHLTCFGQ